MSLILSFVIITGDNLAKNKSKVRRRITLLLHYISLKKTCVYVMCIKNFRQAVFPSLGERHYIFEDNIADYESDFKNTFLIRIMLIAFVLSSF